ncbi:MAG: O-antigen ligase family protein [Gemmataceae bacterium]
MTQAQLTTAAPPARPPAKRPEPNGLGYGLFLLVNVVLFLRPSDFIPGMVGVEVYSYVILACMLVSFPAMIEFLQPAKLERRPIDLCVLLLLPAVVMSHFVHADLDSAWTDGYAFWKILVYYLLFVSLVTTPARLWWFLAAILLCAAVVAVMGMLDFHHVIRLPRMLNIWGSEPVEDTARMYGPGIFQDPNDIALLLGVATVLMLGFLSDKKLGPLRWLGLVPLGLYAYGIYLTQSRGQVLSLAAGLGVLFVTRFGLMRGLLVGTMFAPVVALFFLTRTADLSSQADTGQTRVQLWNDGLVMFKANPVFGVGMNRYHFEAGQVAHNSYIHAFGELGVFGGLLFLTACYLALEGLYRLGQPYLQPGGRWLPRRFADDGLERLYPFVAAAAVTYFVGMFTLTLNYMVMTYTVLGMASMVIATARVSPPVPLTRFDFALLVRMACTSVAFLAFMYVLVRALFRA